MSRIAVVLAAVLAAGCAPKHVVDPVPVVARDAPPAPKAPPPVEPAPPTLRLPRTFLPTSYAARLAIDPAKDGFEGTIEIAGVLGQAVSTLWLSGHDLTIHRARATQGAREIPLAITPHGDDMLEIRAATPLVAGAWTVTIDYAGTFDLLNTTGAFKQTANGEPYVYTQFEAVYARRVFPCFDEPDNKVPWKLTLDVPARLVAVSNTPVASEAPLDKDHKRVEFAVTKPLPSYLIAFGVGPFELIDAGKTKRGTPVRIVTLAKRGGDAAFAAKTVAKVLEIAEDFFGIPYPFEKLDILTIPMTVGFSAMENAGLITVTETLVLFDKPSKGRQHEWIVTAAHEIAHQWFGDLVTMAFWDDIWLNEGFATWLEYKISATYDPSWHDGEADLRSRDEALEEDSLVSARQIRQRIDEPDDILTAFDGITYQKGASVLDMFERYLGPEVFQRGVRAYLQLHAFGNATSADFAAAISKVAGTDVGPAFATFLDQAGAPQLTATVSCSGAPSLALEQTRYLPPGARAPPNGKPWFIPVCVAFDNGGKRGEVCSLLVTPSATIALGVTSCPRWVMPNVGGRGYYYNALTAAQVIALRDEAWPHLTWTERRAVFFDVENAAAIGRLPITLALSFVPKMLAGNDRFTVDLALSLPVGFDDWVPTDLRAKYEQWLRTTFAPGAVAAGFVPRDTDTLDLEQTRGALLGAVAWVARDPELVKQAIAFADRWRELPQSLRGLVLEIAVDAKPELFDKILHDATTEPDRSRREEMFGAVAAARDPKQHLRALALVLDAKIDIRETLGLLFESSNEAARNVSQQFFRDHAEDILKRMPRDETSGSVAEISGLFTATCRADQRDAIVEYVTKTFAKLPGGTRTVAQNIEAMDQCIAKRALLEPEIRGWLSGVKIPKPTPPPAAPKRAGSRDPKQIEGAEQPAPRSPKPRPGGAGSAAKTKKAKK